MIGAFFHPLETPRLLLSDLSEEDRTFVLEEFSNNEINRYLFDAEPMRALSDADELISFYRQAEPRAQHRWVLTCRQTGTRMGTCGFHCWDRKAGSAELGYDLLPAYRGRGLMTEAVRSALTFAQAEMCLRSVDAHIYPDNAGSVHLAERLGFAKSGRTCVYRFRGRDYLHDIYTLTF